MNINDALNQIIFKYNLDKHYPQYQKRYYAEKILMELISDLRKKNKRVFFICEDALEADIIYHISKQASEVKTFRWTGKTVRKLQDANLNSYDKIFVCSFHQNAAMEKELKKLDVSFENIYDIFRTKDICFENSFYKINSEADFGNDVLRQEWVTREAYSNSLQMEFIVVKEQYESVDTDAKRQEFLEKCLFLALCMRDFLTAKEYIKKLIALNIYVEKYSAIWKEIDALLSQIRQIIAGRNKKDIILYWLDTISYEEQLEMPYLQERMEESVCFKNAYTVTPFTNPTLRAMFCKVKQVDDKGYAINKITEENSELLRLIDSNGYGFKVVSGSFRQFSSEYVSETYHETLDAGSIIFWDMLQNIVIAEKPMVLLLHLLDCHAPQLSVKMTSDMIGKSYWRERFELVANELDNQLKYYDGFLSNFTRRIYMSDHGKDVGISHYHILFNVYNGQKEKVDSLFSIINFTEIMENLLKNQPINLTRVSRDYVEIQDVDTYNKALVSKVLKNEMELLCVHFGYKGLITKKHIYMRYTMGKEVLTIRENAESIMSLYIPNDSNADRKLLRYYRELIGDYLDEVKYDEKFRWSKYLYQFYDSQKTFETQKMSLLIEEIRKYPPNSVAIRMGGYNTYLLYKQLSKECKDRIICFIDRNPNCECKEFGLPILSLEEGLELQPQAVILSSYMNIKMLREEAEGYKEKVGIIDIYKYAEQVEIAKERILQEFLEEAGN